MKRLPQRTSSAVWVRGIAELFAAEGLPVPALLAQAGIDPDSLQHNHTRVDADLVSRLWEAAAEQHDLSRLGLDRQLAARYGKLDLLGHAMASAPNLLEGFRQLDRRMALISDAITFSIERDPRGYWLVVNHVGASRPSPRQRVEFAVLTLLTLCDWLTRRELAPLALELVTPPPRDATRHLAAFRVAPRFGQTVNRCLMAESDLLQPLPTHNPALWALHTQLVETELMQLGPSLVSARVRTEITRMLHLGEPRREDVAARLHLTDRTLQRRLHAEGASFQQLLDETRCELARQYLTAPRRSLAEVADQLGFSDPSNLFRACKRWFGMPPGQYRQQLLPPGPSCSTAPAPAC